MSGLLKLPQIYLLGDSLTQQGWSPGGWVSRLAELTVRRLDVVNRGYSGYNTRQLEVLLPHIDLSDARIVVLFIGANDASKPDVNPQQAVPLEEYGRRLESMAGRILKEGAVGRNNLILVSPPPIDVDRWHKFLADERDNHTRPKCPELTRRYAEVCAAAARKLNVPFVDLQNRLLEGGRQLADVLDDGLHLSESGNEVLFELLRPLVEERIGDCRQPAPEWKDFDNADPEKYFKLWSETKM